MRAIAGAIVVLAAAFINLGPGNNQVAALPVALIGFAVLAYGVVRPER